MPGWKLSEEVRIYPFDPDKLIVNLLWRYYSGDNNQPNDREKENGKSKQPPNTGIVCKGRDSADKSRRQEQPTGAYLNTPEPNVIVAQSHKDNRSFAHYSGYEGINQDRQECQQINRRVMPCKLSLEPESVCWRIALHTSIRQDRVFCHYQRRLVAPDAA